MPRAKQKLTLELSIKRWPTENIDIVNKIGEQG